MARARQYDEVDVRRKTLQAFWQKGYAETSLSDLEEASGLDRRQLYNGFGDKREMFLLALDDFDTLAGQMFLAPLEAEDAGLDSIRALLRTFVKLSGTNDGRLGCMVCNGAREEIARDAAVGRRLDDYFARIEAAHRNALSKARDVGDLSWSDDEIMSKARLLLGTQVGMSVLSRAGQDQVVLRDMAEEALKMFD
ncbi:MAG: TetR/AcrR family transcriptional regulator [Hyphomicrobiales bacterium]|nr:TetR/AcrR family transcriptional regulator [Hyphomicrobiales bacterium]